MTEFDGETGVEIMPDMINRPPHYIGKRYEVIDIIEAYGNQFRLGNALKYVLRHKEKGGQEDLRKALWYLEREQSKAMGRAFGTFDVTWWKKNARFIAEDFGLDESVHLNNCVAMIGDACLHAQAGQRPEWEAAVGQAISWLKEYLGMCPEGTTPE